MEQNKIIIVGIFFVALEIGIISCILDIRKEKLYQENYSTGMGILLTILQMVINIIAIYETI